MGIFWLGEMRVQGIQMKMHLMASPSVEALEALEAHATHPCSQRFHIEERDGQFKKLCRLSTAPKQHQASTHSRQLLHPRVRSKVGVLGNPVHCP
jgi:hypothetical protein